MAEFTMRSGRKLVVSISSFEDGNALRKAYLRCQLKSGLQGYESEAEAQQLLCDDELEKLFFQCARKAIYAGAKVDPELFDKKDLQEDARSDYFEIFSTVLGVNLKPFFRNASSASSVQRQTAGSGQQ